MLFCNIHAKYICMCQTGTASPKRLGEPQHNAARCPTWVVDNILWGNTRIVSTQTKICSFLIPNTIILFYLLRFKAFSSKNLSQRPNGVLQEVLVNNNCKHTCICHSGFVCQDDNTSFCSTFFVSTFLDQNNKYCQWYEMRLDATSQCKFTTIIFFCWTCDFFLIFG